MKERKKEREKGRREERKKGKFVHVLEVAVHRGFSCSFCILSRWHTHSCDNILLPSHDVPALPEGFSTCLPHANLKVGQIALKSEPTLWSCIACAEYHPWCFQALVDKYKVSHPLQILLAVTSLPSVPARLRAQPVTSLCLFLGLAFTFRPGKKPYVELRGCPLQLGRGLASFDSWGEREDTLLPVADNASLISWSYPHHITGCLGLLERKEKEKKKKKSSTSNHIVAFHGCV